MADVILRISKDLLGIQLVLKKSGHQSTEQLEGEIERNQGRTGGGNEGRSLGICDDCFFLLIDYRSAKGIFCYFFSGAIEVLTSDSDI